MSSPQLPPEIVDYIVDSLCDEPKALRDCSLVAKSWVPRARKHLFADIKFGSCEDFHSWKTTFPDPPNSPAHQVRTVSIRCSDDFTAADATEGDCISTFPHVARLRLDIGFMSHGVSLASLHRLSSTLKSLHLEAAIFPCSRLFDLVYSLPLLEDLTLDCFELLSDGDNIPNTLQAIVPSISPAFTGSLKLMLLNPSIPTRRLLDLPSGVRFRELTLGCGDGGDLQLLNELVVACSNTLESLAVLCFPSSTFIFVLYESWY